MIAITIPVTADQRINAVSGQLAIGAIRKLKMRVTVRFRNSMIAFAIHPDFR